MVERLQDGAVEFVLVRHGQTPGNRDKRYVGKVDQPLSEEGRAEAMAAGAHPDVERVYVSTLRRTHETAAIMFPNAEQIVVEGVQEMDFGVFSGRSADEMADDPEYRAWVDSGCMTQCPGGESYDVFSQRICDSLAHLLSQACARGDRQLVMVAHGGTMMAFLDRYVPSRKGYWEWLVGNCEGYRIVVEGTAEGEGAAEAEGESAAERAAAVQGIRVVSVEFWPEANPDPNADRALTL